MLNKLLMILVVTLSPALAFGATYKCQGADGKMEFMDRPCDTSKKSILPPKSTAVSQITPLEQLQELFTKFEAPLCERETLMTQLDVARRNQETKKAGDIWKKKQDRLDELNEVQIEFRGKTAKLTQINGIDGAESAALLKFQTQVRICAKEAVATKASASASGIAAVADTPVVKPAVAGAKAGLPAAPATAAAKTAAPK